MSSGAMIAKPEMPDAGQILSRLTRSMIIVKANYPPLAMIESLSAIQVGAFGKHRFPALAP
jgi:hypothetical protein